MSRIKKVICIASLLLLAVIFTLVCKITEPKIKYDLTVIVKDSLLNDRSELEDGRVLNPNEQNYSL